MVELMHAGHVLGSPSVAVVLGIGMLVFGLVSFLVMPNAEPAPPRRRRRV